MMKFGTFSVVVGNEACNARCDFCVAKMTEQLGLKCGEINRRVFDIACRLADKADVTTALLTGKGEPTLFPDQISDYLVGLEQHNFPLIELQTNGLVFLKDKTKTSGYKTKWVSQLTYWRGLGLTTVALSIVDYTNPMNQLIYCNDGAKIGPEYPDLTETILFLVRSCGLSVRLNCIGIAGGIDSVRGLQGLLRYVQGFQDDGHDLQLTWRPVQMPRDSRSDKVAYRTRELQVSQERINSIQSWADAVGTVLYKLPHGATVYDIKGQNLCLSNCLTIQPDLDEIRQIIYVDGHIRYDWQHRGAIIL